MVLVTTSWQRWAGGLAVSLVVFAVLYLTVIQPSTNTANQAVKAGMQQTQQATKQAQQQINSASAGNPASGASGHASKQFASAVHPLNARSAVRDATRSQSESRRPGAPSRSAWAHLLSGVRHDPLNHQRS